MSLKHGVRGYLFSFNFLILVIFTLQNSSSVLLLSYIQQRNDGAENAHRRFNSLHFLMVIEMGKFVVSLLWSGFDIRAAVRVAVRENKQKALQERQQKPVKALNAFGPDGVALSQHGESQQPSPTVGDANAAQGRGGVPAAARDGQLGKDPLFPPQQQQQQQQKQAQQRRRGGSPPSSSTFSPVGTDNFRSSTNATNTSFVAASTSSAVNSATDFLCDVVPPLKERRTGANGNYVGHVGEPYTDDDEEGEGTSAVSVHHGTKEDGGMVVVPILTERSDNGSRHSGNRRRGTSPLTDSLTDNHGATTSLHPRGAKDSGTGCTDPAFLRLFVDRYLTEVAVLYLRPRKGDHSREPTAPDGCNRVDALAGEEDGVDQENARSSSPRKGASGGRRTNCCPSGTRCLSWFLENHVNKEALFMAVPAIAYAIQNMLMLDAIGKLNPLVYQITIQVRILLVALAMKLVMRTSLTSKKWASLVTLFFGVVLGQMGAAPKPKDMADGAPVIKEAGTAKQKRHHKAGKGAKHGKARAAALASRAVAPLSWESSENDGVVPPLGWMKLRGGYLLSSDNLTANGIDASSGDGNENLREGAVEAASAAAAASIRFMSGMTSLFMGCCISVFASVYMEAVFKKRSSFSFLSTRNVHLAFFSILYFGGRCWNEYAAQREVILNLVGGSTLGEASSSSGDAKFNRFNNAAFDTARASGATAAAPFRDAHGVIHVDKTLYYDSLGPYLANYFHNFDGFVWAAVAVNVAGGMLIALLLRYSDNIMKTMSTAAAIVLSGVGSYVLFDAELNEVFLLGAAFVILAVVMYNLW